jgi:hypothetical protein
VVHDPISVGSEQTELALVTGIASIKRSEGWHRGREGHFEFELDCSLISENDS